jgi:uncharacterized membrane protein
MSVLPPPQKAGEIKFFIAKSLPYRPRMALVGLCLACGVGLQVTIGFWPGFALLVLGQLLGMSSGYDATPRITGEEAWEKVTPDDYTKVKIKAAELKKWHEDFFDGTSTSGVVGFLIVMVLCVGGYFAAAARWRFPDGYWVFFGLDAAVLLVPLWFVGTRTYLTKDQLVIKIGMLEEIMAGLQNSSEVQVQPMLSLEPTESGGKEPEDARLMVKIVGAPEAFYGVQVQSHINNVQGTDYPYLYCVIIAKQGSCLLDGALDLAKQPEHSFITGIVNSLFSSAGGVGNPELVYEPSVSGEVDIVVVRQQTTTSSGYCTTPSAARTIVDYSLKLAAALLNRNRNATGAGLNA